MRYICTFKSIVFKCLSQNELFLIFLTVFFYYLVSYGISFIYIILNINFEDLKYVTLRRIAKLQSSNLHNIFLLNKEVTVLNLNMLSQICFIGFKSGQCAGEKKTTFRFPYCKKFL